MDTYTVFDSADRAREASKELQVEVGNFMMAHRQTLDSEVYDLLGYCYSRLGNDAYMLRLLIEEAETR